MQHRLARILGIVLLILLIPFFGNMFVEGWNWLPFDFVVMGILLFVTGLALDTAARKIADPAARMLACGAIVFALVAIWTELAVGAVSQLVVFIL